MTYKPTNKAKLEALESRLFWARQTKQGVVSIIIGFCTIVFLDSIHTLCNVLNIVSLEQLFPCLMLVFAYAVWGSICFGTLARLAFVRHIKRVKADIRFIKSLESQLPSKPEPI
ncbi:MAG TPA: hypothetical protein VFV28_10915 [Limnobacter sp.]|nr:hypothetical protein [Limnobacter sp.]